MSIVYEPPQKHHCGPNQYGHWHLDWDLSDPPGTVRECCGKTWVAYRDTGDPGYMGIKWRPEGWLDRRLRERRARTAQEAQT